MPKSSNQNLFLKTVLNSVPRGAILSPTLHFLHKELSDNEKPYPVMNHPETLISPNIDPVLTYKILQGNSFATTSPPLPSI
jgi:hypothetical protein